MKYVKFSASEMAYDVPADLSDVNRYPVVARGPKEWKKFINFRNGYVRLNSEIRKHFKTEEAVRQALQAVTGPDSRKLLPGQLTPPQRRDSTGKRRLNTKRKIA